MSEDDYDYEDDAGAGISFQATPRSSANLLLEPINLGMQVEAVRSLLKRNRDEEARMLARFNEIKARPTELFGDDYGEAFYESVYQDATHAQAAIGMIAPLWESILVRLFKDLLVVGARKAPEHVRWTAPDKDPKKGNCKFYWDRNKKSFRDDIISGIPQMCKMVEIGSILNQGDLLRINAMFTYRNFMFHNGIEWPAEQLAKFAENTAKWPEDWFSSARQGNDPWIYYMTDSLIDDCLSMLERFVDGVGSLFMDWNARTGQSFEVLRPKHVSAVD